MVQAEVSTDMMMNLGAAWPPDPKPHPSRSEWQERQLFMPQGMRTMIDSYLTVKNAEHAAQLAREEAKAKTLRDRLAGFEVALREVLAGAEWLAPFREANPDELRQPFSLSNNQWFAFYNLEFVGGWRLMVMIPLSNHSWDVWSPSQAEFTAILPTHQTSTNELNRAMWLASQYCNTPF